MNINTIEINTAITNLTSHLDDLRSEYKKIASQITGLKNSWAGLKADAFYDYMENIYLPAFETAINNMNKYIEYLNRIPNTYRLLDDCYHDSGIDI